MFVSKCPESVSNQVFKTCVQFVTGVRHFLRLESTILRNCIIREVCHCEKIRIGKFSPRNERSGRPVLKTGNAPSEQHNVPKRGLPVLQTS